METNKKAINSPLYSTHVKQWSSLPQTRKDTINTTQYSNPSSDMSSSVTRRRSVSVDVNPKKRYAHQDLWDLILSWPPYVFLSPDLDSNGCPMRPLLNECSEAVPVPDVFQSYDEYVSIMKPLILMEICDHVSSYILLFTAFAWSLILHILPLVASIAALFRCKHHCVCWIAFCSSFIDLYNAGMSEMQD